MCYGVFTYRDPLSKSTEYTNAKVTNLDFSKTMLYLIDGINNSLYDGMDNIFFTKAGSSKYASSGDVYKRQALNSSAHCNALIGVQTLMSLFAHILIYSLDNSRNSCRTAYKKHFVNIRRRKPGIGQCQMCIRDRNTSPLQQNREYCL